MRRRDSDNPLLQRSRDLIAAESGGPIYLGKVGNALQRSRDLIAAERTATGFRSMWSKSCFNGAAT